VTEIQLEVTTAVVHDVPRRGSGEPLVLADDPIELEADLRSYFARKITGSVERRGLQVVADLTASPIVRDGVREALAEEGALVAASQTMARHLDAIQTERNSPGLLVVALGMWSGRPCVAVVKLEREEGLRVHLSTRGGRNVVSLELLRELALTNKTRVFKAALLTLGDKAESASLFGQASDDQRARDEGPGVAGFFLSDFLGCRLRTNPEKATRDFFNAAQDFFNTAVADPERRVRYLVALLARMEDQVMDLNPRIFARASIEAADRPGFLERIAQEGLDPGTAFQKDTALIKSSGFRMTFDSGMTLLGERAHLAERVQVEPDRVILSDTVKRLRGR
jgi:hypothetical protein